MAKLVLTQPLSGASASSAAIAEAVATAMSTAVQSASYTTKVTMSLLPSVDTVTDQVMTSGCSVVKWTYTLRDNVENKTHSAEIMASHRNGTHPTHTRYAVTGDNIPHNVTVVIESGMMKLRFTNQDTHTLIANMLRTLTP